MARVVCVSEIWYPICATNVIAASLANPTRDLAEFVADLRWIDVPVRVRQRTTDILLDTFACALAGWSADESIDVLAVAQALFGDGGSTVIGSEPLSSAAATMTNGYLVTAVTMCDVHRPTLCHATPEVVPPVLALGEERDVSGRDLLLAIVAGLEITTRVNLGLNYAEFRARGWHSSGVTGPLGAAVACGRLLDFDATQMVHALGVAGSQAAGTFAQFGTPTIKSGQALGAIAGLMAARVVAEGLTACDEILMYPEGGLYRTYSDGGNPGVVLHALGDRWELENISLRRWPVAAYLQPVVSTILALVANDDFESSRVRRLQLWISPRAYRLHGEVGWEDSLRARLSARYVAAVTMFDRRCWLDQFTSGRIADVPVTSFATERVQVHEDSSLPDFGVRVGLEFDDGAVTSASHSPREGDAVDLLSHAEIAHKFRAAAAPWISSNEAEAFVDRIAELESQSGVRGLIETLRRNPGNVSQGGRA